MNHSLVIEEVLAPEIYPSRVRVTRKVAVQDLVCLAGFIWRNAGGMDTEFP